MGLANINVRFSTNLAELSTQMQNASRQFKSFGEGLKSFGSQMSLFATAPLVAAGTAAYGMAADFEDALGATDQIFKNASGSVKEWADSLPTYFGIAEKEALEYSNMMGSMLVNIGNLTKKEASEQSAKLIELAGDLTAMYGGTTADAVRALTGSLKGNNTMLDNYGMAVNDAMVKTKALELGLMKQGGQMTLSAKQAATLALIYEQTGAAQGQAAREAEGASGSMRTLKTEFTNLTTQLGQQLLPMITPLIQKLVEMSSKFSNLQPETKKTIVIVGALVAAIGPLSLGIGTVLTLVPTMITGFVAVKTAFASLTAVMLANPFTAIATALAALVAIVVVANTRFSALTNVAKEMDAVTQTATGSIAKQRLELENLLKVAQNEKLSLEERQKALDKIKAKSDTYLGNLTLEKINTNEAKTAVDKYTASLLQNAKAKAAKDKLEQVEKQLLDLELGVSDKTQLTFGQNLKAMIKGTANTLGGFKLYQIEYENENYAQEKKNLEDLKTKLLTLSDSYKDSSDVVEETTTTTTGFGDALKKVAEKGSVDWLNEQIEKIEDLRNAQKLSRDEYLAYNSVIDDYKNQIKEISELNEKQTAIKPIKLDLVGSQDYYSKQLENLNKLRDAAVIGTAEWLKLDNQIKDIEVKVKASVDATTFENAKVAMQEIPMVYNAVAEEIKQNQANWAANMQGVYDGLSSGISDAFGMISDGIVNSMGEAETGMQRFHQAMMQTVIKVIAMALSASVANAIQGGTQSGAATGPGAIVAIPTMIATLVAGVIGAFAAIPKFANGGIVSGPTLGLMGEYAGAANNPEVIAPLNKLKELIEPAGVGDLNISLGAGVKIAGSDLMLVLERAERIKNRKV